MGQKVILGFGGNLGYSLRAETILPLFADFVRYACLRLYSAIVPFSQNNCLYFACYG